MSYESESLPCSGCGEVNCDGSCDGRAKRLGGLLAVGKAKLEKIMSPHDPDTKYTKTEEDLITCIDALCDIAGASVDKSSPENLEGAVEDFKDTAQIAVNSVQDPRGPIGPIGPIPDKSKPTTLTEPEEALCDLVEQLDSLGISGWAGAEGLEMSRARVIALDLAGKSGKRVKYDSADPENERKMLIDLCERSIVNVKSWSNRDSHHSQERVGSLWALLKAGCEFRIMDRESDGSCKTDDRTIWIEVSEIPDFGHMDAGGKKAKDTFYLPTPKRLEEASGDWY